MKESLSALTGWLTTTQARFMSWPPIAWFWRIYGVCAMQRIWTSFMVLIAFLSANLTFGCMVDLLLNSIPVLEEMDHTQGTLVSFYKPLRTVHDSSIRIRTEDGKIHKFRGDLYPEETRLLATKLGKPVTIWSQPTYKGWLPFYYQRFWVVEFAGPTVIDHFNINPDPQWWVKAPDRVYGLMKFSFKLMVFCLFVVFLRCRKCDERIMNK